MTPARLPDAPRVLLVEDESIIAMGVKQNLLDLGYDVPEIVARGDGIEERVVRLRPDLVLMDINLQGVRDGIEVASDLARRHRTPVVFLTAYADDETIQRAQKIGSFGFLVKPYEERELHSTLQIALSRARIERELERTASWFHTCLDSLAEGVLLCDATGRVSYLNHAASTLAGFPKGRLLGRPAPEIMHDAGITSDTVHLLDRQIREGLAHQCHDSGHPDSATLRPRYFDIRLSPVRDRDGRLVGSVLLLRDETEQRQREKEVARRNNLESLGRLAGGIAHDFNNLLTIIVANTSMLKFQAQELPQLLPHLDRIQHASDRAAQIANQFITFAKGGSPVRREVSLGQLVIDVLRNFPRAPGIEIDARVPADLLSVRADRQQLAQVLVNVLENAQEALPSGGIITVEARNVTPAELPGTFSGERAARFVRLSVRDAGRGIRDEDLPRIFDPYFSTKPGGVGLGLSSVHSIVSRHGGHTGVESRFGHGTTLTIFFPALDQADLPGIAPTAAGTDFYPGRVLVMDDEEMVRVSVKRMLENIGCEVETAAEGEEAIARYTAARERGKPFDAVLLDLLVPRGMGGEEAARQILKIDPQARCVVASGYSAHPVLSQYRTYGFKAVLQKPFGMVELKKTLRGLGVGVETRTPF